jgi:hypothetical protein
LARLIWITCRAAVRTAMSIICRIAARHPVIDRGGVTSARTGQTFVSD